MKNTAYSSAFRGRKSRMVRAFLVLLSVFSLSGAAAQESDSTTAHTLFLIGDGGEPYVRDSPIGRVVREKIGAAGGNSTVLFLGDNIYPAGMPEAHSKKYALAELALRTQVDFVQGLPAKGIFIPGNHDWQHWGRKGLDYLRNQQRWLDSLHDERITLLPRDGCPGPVQLPLDDNTLLVILDTQWFLHQWEKPEDPGLCQVSTTAEVLMMVEDIFRSNRGKRIIVAGHHPLITYGEHGGVFTWKAHLFPLEEITKYLYIPLPVIGSIYPLYRKWFGHLQDTPHPLYREFSKALQRIMKDYPGSFYVAGHEHALQYIVKDSTHFIVSGSASKTEYVRKKGYAVYARDVRGFTRLLLRADGSIDITFFQVDKDHPDGLEVFTRTVPRVPDVAAARPGARNFDRGYVRVNASDQYSAGKVRQRLLGKNYRAAWAQKIDVPVFDIRTAQGGLKVLQKGGGQQTLSLRLADSSGREYVLRSVEKYPERAIPEVLRETFAQDLVQDQISAAHPYAALVIPPMAEALGLYHTNPRLVYIPDDPALGEYRGTFANTLALFEERPDEDWSHASYFGHSENIISTQKVVEKLAGDNDNRVDEPFVLRNRLFDLIIGDWDRHDDQWRWATEKSKQGDRYRPIPRDRDQAFFVNQGMLARIWSRKWALPKFEGFDEDIDWAPGLSFNARHFDRTFLSGLSQDEWIATAEDLKHDLTDDVIENAIRTWPSEIFNAHGEEVIRNIKSRRNHIVSDAISYYRFLARAVDVRGSDKREAFDVSRLANGDVQVRVYKIGKKGAREKELYNRTFRKNETREIRLYGLDGDDVFEITGSAKRSILLRVIGGGGDDSLSDTSVVKGLGKKTIFYDEPAHGDFTSSGEVSDKRAPDPSVNEYSRFAFRYDRLAPLLYGNYNYDDGIFAGAGFLWLRHGFRKDPFSQRHFFLASVAPLTSSYDFRYQGKFTDVAGEWDFELHADIKAPNYVNNFFGMGNESVFDNDVDEQEGLGVEQAIHYYRYRFEELSFAAFLSRDVGGWGNIRLGPMLQRIEMEEPRPGQARYIGQYAATLPTDLFSEFKTFGGIAWQLESGSRSGESGEELFQGRGSLFEISGKHLAGLNEGVDNFSSYHASLSLYHSFRERSRLVFAGRVGGGVNSGEYPFYQAQVLDGKTMLRGYHKTRFYGDAMLFANAELRLRLLDFRSYLFPASLGILGFHDVGRIWYKNEQGIDPSASGGKSNVWHKAWGGGIWFTPFNLTVLSVEAGHSPEGTLGYVRLGFLF